MMWTKTVIVKTTTTTINGSNSVTVDETSSADSPELQAALEQVSRCADDLSKGVADAAAKLTEAIDKVTRIQTQAKSEGK